MFNYKQSCTGCFEGKINIMWPNCVDYSGNLFYFSRYHLIPDCGKNLWYVTAKSHQFSYFRGHAWQSINTILFKTSAWWKEDLTFNDTPNTLNKERQKRALLSITKAICKKMRSNRFAKSIIDTILSICLWDFNPSRKKNRHVSMSVSILQSW